MCCEWFNASRTCKSFFFFFENVEVLSVYSVSSCLFGNLLPAVIRYSNARRILLMYVSKSQIGSEHFVPGINRSSSLGSNTVSQCMAGGGVSCPGKVTPCWLEEV